MYLIYRIVNVEGSLMSRVRYKNFLSLLLLENKINCTQSTPQVPYESPGIRSPHEPQETHWKHCAETMTSLTSLLWLGGGMSRASLRFEKILNISINLRKYRYFTGIFLNRSEALGMSIVWGGGGDWKIYETKMPESTLFTRGLITTKQTWGWGIV